MGEYLAKVKAIKFEGIDEPLIGLFPKDKTQREKLIKLKPDDIVAVTYKTFRSKNHLDQAHAITHYLWSNWRDPGHYPSVDVFRAFISIELGFHFPVYRGGQVLLIPETWSYKTDQADFMKRLYNPLIDFAIDYFQIKSEKNKSAMKILIEHSKEHYFNFKLTH